MDSLTEKSGATARRLSSPASLARSIAGYDIWDVATTALLVGLTAIALLTVRHYALSNDEPVQHHYGELILQYYQSWFADDAVFKFRDLYLYGGLFDIVAVALSHIIPIEPYELRHIICLMFGIGGIAAVAATARLIAGSRAALFAGIALASCGAWYGTMFTHTKDIPFAAALAGALLMLIHCARAFPTPRRRDVVLLGVLTGVALGIRVLGLLIPFYVAFAVLLYGPAPLFSRDRVVFALRSVAALLPAAVIAYVIMIASWPYAALEPFNPIRALSAFSGYHFTIRTLLAGKIYDMADVPRYYIPLYFLIRVPLATLCAAVLALAFAFWPRGERTGEARQLRTDVAFVVLTAAFPVLCEVITHGPAVTGIRHFLYVLAPLAVLAGVGADAVLSALSQRQRQLGLVAAVVMAGLYVWYGSILVRLHPYEYVYYNSVVGGAEGAARKYDMDYWVNSMPEMVGDLEAYLRRTEPAGATPRTYTVAVCGEKLAWDKSVTMPQLQWTDMKHWEKADFFIAPTQMFCDRILGGKVIATVERMGAAIGYVKDRRSLTRPALAAAH